MSLSFSKWHTAFAVQPKHKQIFRGFAALAFVAAMCSTVSAGNFSQTWGTAPNAWTPLSLGPNTYTLTDQHGFQLDVRYTIARANGVSAGNFPDDLLTDGAGNTFGTVRSIWNVWNPNLSGGGIGGSTNTAVMEILNGTTAFPVNGLNFTASDIDAVDSNNAGFANDRCDHVTFTGNAGNPSLAAVTASPTFLIGPGPGAGASPALARNQVQCNFQVSTSVASPSSNANDNGTVRATYPDNTSIATVLYDESIHNVSGITSVNALARGIGIWSSTAFTAANNTITLDKQSTSPHFSTAGNVLNYTYVVTNNGPLPLNAGQNIQIQDSKIGLITCPAIPASGIAVGGTHTCTANYTVVAADVTAALVTNTATAGVGIGAMAFASRLQSNSDIVTVPRANPQLSFGKTASPMSVTAAGQTITYRLLVGNSGNTVLNNITVSDPLGTVVCPSSGTAIIATLAAGTNETCSLNYVVTQADFNSNGGGDSDIDNTAQAATSFGGTSLSQSGSRAVSLVITPNLVLTKQATTAGPFNAGDTVTYRFRAKNIGNVTLTNINVADSSNGNGGAVIPSGEGVAVVDDAAPTGDSTDGASNGSWDVLAPGDTVEFTANYTVVQNDVNWLQ